MRWMILLCTTVRLFAIPFDEMAPSEPEEIASLNADLLVEGYVSAASGQLCLRQTDLHVRGAQDVLLQRIYIPPQILGRYDEKGGRDRLLLGKSLKQQPARGWISIPHLYAGYNRKSPYFQVRDSNGTVFQFQIDGNRGHLKTSSFGCSNFRGEKPSAEADIRNIECLVDGSNIKIIWPSGIERTYRKNSTGFYLLDCEWLPNGKAIRYSYNGRELIRVYSTDASGKYIYASIDIPEPQLYKGSDGREAKYIYEKREIHGRFKEGDYKAKKDFQFRVLAHAVNPTYSNSAGYNNRLLLTSYDEKKFPISCTYSEPVGSLCRIQNFFTPSGSTLFAYDSPIPGKKGGSTTVTHPNGSQTVYRFNAKFLLVGLENWMDGKLKIQKLFCYDNKQHISKIETKDASGNLLLAKTFECDASGNPISEKWEADIGLFSIQRTFSKNRLVKEISNDGLQLEYTYLENTHLPTCKIVSEDGSLIRKTEYFYDEACNLIEEREVGKTVTIYILYQSGAHLHRPEWKIEKDWEGNLIHKMHFAYDQFGHLVKEDHYGSDDRFAYRTAKNYDSQDNLLAETNPLGQTATYSYDNRGRQIQEIPFANNKTIHRSFDEKGRLTILQEGDHKTQYRYNSSDELIQKTDYLGLETHYRYHPIHGKVTWMSEGPTLLEIIYDDFGREILRKDAYGSTTVTHPNSYGEPLLITYPDGGREFFCYEPNRLLRSVTDPDGLTTVYTYDPFKRITSKTVGKRKTTYRYDAYDLLEEQNPLGICTQYQYNASGQKIREIKGNRITQFSYDSLGFLSKVEKENRTTTYQNDLLGRVLRKSKDNLLDISYTYDAAGNVASISKLGTTRFVYDPYNRLIEQIEADDAKTTIVYEEGALFLTKTTTDPKKSKKIEIYDAHGLLLKKEVPGCILEEFSYDRELRLISHDHLTFTYTPQGYRSSMTEAGERTTFWSYTPGGKVATQTKPDGLQLLYEYTEHGELACVGSRQFKYDDLGRIINGTGFSREYDPFGNILLERFETGLSVKTSYNDFDQPTCRILPDHSHIQYEYDGPFLTKICRYTADGKLLYIHAYDQFDAEGHVLSETGFFNNSYQYDLRGRRILQMNPFFSENLVYDEAGNLLQKNGCSYVYDAADQLIASQGKFNLLYDKHYNRIAENNKYLQVNALNEIAGHSYNENGCLVQQGFVYDEFDQLVEAGGEKIFYDALGRRLQKGEISYLYFGDDEIGAFVKGSPIELKIPGLLAPIALEIDHKPHFPIADVQGVVRMLVDADTSKICFENSCDPFGVGSTCSIPYAYMGKRYDAATGLIYFGKRYYVPSLGRWLTPDPLGPIDHSNLYQYVFNNPYRFKDPNGESIGGYLLGLGEIVLGGGFSFDWRHFRSGDCRRVYNRFWSTIRSRGLAY